MTPERLRRAHGPRWPDSENRAALFSNDITAFQLLTTQLKGLPSARPSLAALLSGEGACERLQASASGDLAWETAQRGPELGFIRLPRRAASASSPHFPLLNTAGQGQ